MFSMINNLNFVSSSGSPVWRIRVSVSATSMPPSSNSSTMEFITVTVLAPPRSRTSPVAVTVAVMLARPDPTSESRTPSMLIESDQIGRLTHIGVYDSDRDRVAIDFRISGIPPIVCPQMFTSMLLSSPVGIKGIRNRDAEIDEHRPIIARITRYRSYRL